MALKATIYKATLQIADLDRPYYGEHVLTMARHPSETDRRLMVRLLAFALHASDRLAFGAGLSTEDEPDLWQRDLTGAVELWVELGQPDERRLRRACGRAERVYVYGYSGNAADVWWSQLGPRLAALPNLAVVNLPNDSAEALAGMAQRSMQLACTVQDGQVWLADDDRSIQVEFEVRKPMAGATAGF